MSLMDDISDSTTKTVETAWNNFKKNFGDFRNTLIEGMESVGNWIIGNDYKSNAQLKDATSENLGTEIITPIEQPNALNEAIKLRDEEWARADAIRKETQEREDTAYSRGIQDLRNSGVNVNLLGNVSAAPTGGGITNETGSVNYALAEKEYQAQIDLLMQEIEHNFQGNQAEKDRIKDLVKSILTAGALLGGAGIKAAGK